MEHPADGRDAGQLGSGDDSHDTRSLYQIHDRFGSWIASRVRSLFPRDWEDIVQEVMLRLARTVSRLRRGDDQALRAVISKTVRSVCVDEIRRRARSPAVQPAAAGDERREPEDPRGGAGLGRLELGEDQQRVAAAFATLSERERRIIALRFRDGLGFREIAQLLDVPQGSVAGWYSRAMVKLREALP